MHLHASCLSIFQLTVHINTTSTSALIRDVLIQATDPVVLTNIELPNIGSFDGLEVARKP